MTLSENLPYLRTRQNMTQEQLAEKLDVSRQSVSKWESGTSYPEMETILKLCDIFHIDMDTLLRGSAEKSLAEDSAGYDRFMNLFALKVAGAVAGFIVGAAAAALSSVLGLSEMVSMILILGTVAVCTIVLIASGMEEDNFRKQNPTINNFYTDEQKQQFRRRLIWYVAGSVGAILFGVILLIWSDGNLIYEEWMGGLFLFIIAGAVFFLVYGGMLEDKYNIAKYNWKNNPSPEDRIRRRRVHTAYSLIMILATALYVGLGMAINGWRTAAVIYPVAGILCAAARTLLGPKMDEE
jgi:transcriptional regulator with XRE-family HTH domain